MMLNIQRHWLVILSAWLSRIVSVSAQLIAIRMIISILGEEQYAVFVLISALSGWLLLTEMGLGSSLQNAISARRAQQKNYADLITTVLAALVPITLVWIGLLYLLSPYLAEHYLAEYQHLLVGGGTTVFFLAVLLFSGVSLGTVINKIWYAQQQGWWANLVIATGWLLGLLAVYIYGNYQHDNHSIFNLTLYFFLPQSLIGWCSFLFFLLKSLLTKRSLLTGNLVTLAKKSAGFWWFSVLAALVLQVDYIVMSQLISKQEIVQYSIVTRVFALVAFVFAAILQALWPVCAEAAELHNWQKIVEYKNRYIKIGLLFVMLCTILMLLTRHLIVDILAPGKAIFLPVSMIIMLGIYQLIRVWCDTYSMLLMSLNYLKPLWILVPIQATISISFQWYGALYFDYIGMIVGLILSFILTVFIGFPYFFSKYLIKKQQAI